MQNCNIICCAINVFLPFQEVIFLEFQFSFLLIAPSFLVVMKFTSIAASLFFFAFQDCPDDDEMHPMPAPSSRLCNKPNSPQRNGFIFPLFFLVVSVQITQGYYLLSALLLAFFSFFLSFPPTLVKHFLCLPPSPPHILQLSTTKQRSIFATQLCVCGVERAHITPLSSRLLFLFFCAGIAKDHSSLVLLFCSFHAFVIRQTMKMSTVEWESWKIWRQLASNFPLWCVIKTPLYHPL